MWKAGTAPAAHRPCPPWTSSPSVFGCPAAISPNLWKILCGPTRSVSGSCGCSWRSGSDFRAEWRRSGEPGSSARWSEPWGLIGWRRGRPAAAKGSPPHTESWSRNKGRCPGSKERSRSSSSGKSWQPSEPTAKPCRWREHTTPHWDPARCARSSFPVPQLPPLWKMNLFSPKQSTHRKLKVDTTPSFNIPLSLQTHHVQEKKIRKTVEHSLFW